MPIIAYYYLLLQHMDIYQKKTNTFRKQWSRGIVLKYESKGLLFEPDHVHCILLLIFTYYYYWKSFLSCFLSVDVENPKYCCHRASAMAQW